MKRIAGGIAIICIAVTGIAVAGIALAQEPDSPRERVPQGRFGGDTFRGNPSRGESARDEAAPPLRERFSRRGEAAEAGKIPTAGKTVSFNITILEANQSGKPKPAIDLSNADKIAEQVRALEEKGVASVISRVRLSSVEQMPCSVQIGESKPTVTGRSQGFPGRDGARGPNQASYQYHNVGMMVKVVSRVESDEAVLAEIELSSSRLAPTAKPADEGAIPPERTTTMSTQSTVRIPKGQAVVVSASQSAGDDESRETLVLITAKVESSPAAVSADDAKTSDKSVKTFHLQNASATETASIIKAVYADYPIDAGADVRTNSVIIRAAEGKLGEIEALIRKIESEPTFKQLDHKE